MFSKSRIPLVVLQRRLLSSSKVSRANKEVKNTNKRTWIEHVADVRSPHLWYPAARALKPRIITCHVGPTNSGKTYAALEALKTSQSGIYCGPLRLLAWEITEILRKSEFGDSGTSIACSLITGQEKDIMDGATHVSCTVEMASLSDDYECAVIDEMQLIGDRERGWAWTQAFLGLRCRNIHVCGNGSFLPLLRQICSDTGDTLVVREYARLSPLSVAPDALGTYGNITPGDCVVGFSRSKLYQIKASVERDLNRTRFSDRIKRQSADEPVVVETKCCVIYGNLPPDTRRQQAALFNQHNTDTDQPSDTQGEVHKSRHLGKRRINKGPNKQGRINKGPNNVNNSVLVATDAIGMGLNLSIRRVIFSSLMKFDGHEHRDLHPTEVKQIAGRAGRYCGSYSEGGVVTTFHRGDLEYLAECLDTPDTDLTTAGILPTLDHLHLLHLLVSYNVTQAQISAFYQSQFHEETESEGAARTVTTSDLFDHFGSIRRLVEYLTSYLQEVYFQLDVLDDTLSASAIHPSFLRKGKKTTHNLPRENVMFSELLNLYQQSQQARDKGADTDNHGNQRKKRYTISTTGSASPAVNDDDAATDMENEHVDKYIICELNEMIQISQLLDQFTSDELPMAERYQWCLAPINLDNSLLLSLFPQWAEEYVDSVEVTLHLTDKNLNRYRYADTPEALLQLEKLHQSIEVYIWLGFRFGDEVFIDMVEAQKYCNECRKLIELGLESVGKAQDTKRWQTDKGGRGKGAYRRGGDRSRQINGLDTQ